jgi:hypothetical protein
VPGGVLERGRVTNFPFRNVNIHCSEERMAAIAAQLRDVH